MQRRDFMKKVGAGSLALGASAAGIKTAQAGTEHEWKMVTTWPKNFPGLGTGANKLAELIGEMSGGRIKVKVYGAKELVPAFEVFDAVSRGTAEIGHGAAYYWKGKSEAAQFFTTVPFGMTAQEMNGWLYHGGGLELWTELLGRYPENLAARSYMASDLIKLGRTQEAAAALEQVSRSRGLTANEWNSLGWCREQAGDLEGARAAYGEALEIDPAQPFARGNLERVSGK